MHVRLFGRKPWALIDMAAGINRNGDSWIYRDFKEHDFKHYGIDCDAVCIMGWVPEGIEFGNYYKKNIPVYYITDGYVARRTYGNKKINYGPGVHFGVSRDLPGGYGRFYGLGEPGDRWNKLGIPLPTLRKLGDDILIGFQETPDLHGKNRHPYFVEVRDVVTNLEDRNMRLRMHPRFDSRVNVEKTIIYGFQGEVSHANEVSLKQDLENCRCLITYDSNLAVEAALLGYPIVECGKSMAHPIATTWDFFKKNRGGLKLPTDKKLQSWAYWLAYQQWTRDEMAAGETWAYLKESIKQ